MDKFSSGGYTYFKLHIPCPVCRERGINTPQSNWKHATNNCEGEIYIGDDANYFCKKCNHKSHIIKGWRKYKCPMHSTSDDYYIFSNAYYVDGPPEIIACLCMMVSAVGNHWLIKCLENLGDW